VAPADFSDVLYLMPAPPRSAVVIESHSSPAHTSLCPAGADNLHRRGV